MSGARRRSGPSRPELGSKTWRKLRTVARHRDHNMCQRCASTWRLSVHHLVPRKYGGTDDLSNLLTLCSTCHAQAEAQFRRAMKHTPQTRAPQTQRTEPQHYEPFFS